MASLSRETTRSGNVGWRIVWTDSEGKQKALRLGPIPRRAAERMLLLTERLWEARQLGLPLDSETARWIETLADPMAERLARLDLVSPRNTITVADFLERWIEDRRQSGASKEFLIAWGQTARELTGLFGHRALPASSKPTEKRSGKICNPEASDLVRSASGWTC